MISVMTESSDDTSDREHEAKPSSLSTEVAELKETILRFAKERDRLPQPLFWSLFNARISEIKKTKSQSRELEDLLGT
jgi:hypothetical protein